MDNRTFQISQVSIEDFIGMIDEKINQSFAKFLNVKNGYLESKDFFTRQETAAYFGVSLGTLNNWAKKGTLVPINFEGRVYYTRIEIQTKLGLAS
ncbi:helix-turn-helix domain-containing protein [Chryseobacterium artocarpi]|uniref:helix-turn-helix domain-containing protein n=1 Tax=Chryseobacterium artocarpi TaxID=1414727 RepID=UPI003F3F6FD4